jgi:PTS system ascorbate-specific IIA component
MSVALLLVTHEHIGNDMLMITGSILNDELSNTACVEIPMNADIDSMKNQVANTLNELSTDDGVLILTDSYGSTPSNIANEFLDSQNRALVSGVNLPMLIRIMNYRSLPLDELKQVAIEGGKHGITSKPN